MVKRTVKWSWKNVLGSTILAGIIAFGVGVLFTQQFKPRFGTYKKWYGELPVMENVAEAVAIYAGAFLGPMIYEMFSEKELYDEYEILLAMFFFTPITLLTIGLGFLRPSQYHPFLGTLAGLIGLTAGFEVMLFHPFAIAFEKATELI